jgi:hypothetical protein
MTLQDEIKDFNKEIMPSIPPEVINAMTKAAEDLAASDIVNRALSTGDTMPPFSLPNIHGQIVTSEDLLSKGTQVISFYRGSW